MNFGTKFYKPSPNDAFVIATIPKSLHRFRVTSMLLFHTLKRKRSCVFFEDLLPH